MHTLRRTRVVGRGGGGWEMDLVAWMGPALAAMVTAALLSTAGFLRRELWERVSGRLLLVAASGLFLIYLVAVRAGLARELVVPDLFLARAAGLALLGGAALLALKGSRARRLAELMLARPPTPLDEAVEALRAGGAGEGVFRGRLGAEQPLTSPGGLVCALYEAEVREAAPGGQRGSLISIEKALPAAVSLKGERVECRVELGAASVLGPRSVRRCTVGSELAMSAAPLLASGPAATDALSYERVGKLGETCLVVGRLTRSGHGELGYRVGPGLAAPVVLVLAPDATPYGRRLSRSAWACFAFAFALCAASAAVLASAT